MTALNRDAAIAAVNAAEIFDKGFAKAGSIDGVVQVIQHGKFLGSFRVQSDGKVLRAGLRKMRSSSAERVVTVLEAAGFEMVD